MKKEIFEQPAVIGDTLLRAFQSGDAQRPSARPAVRSRRGRAASRIIACGTSFHAGAGRQILARADRARARARSISRRSSAIARADMPPGRRSPSSSRNRARPPTRSRRCAMPRRRASTSSRWSTSPKARSRARPTRCSATHAGPEIGVASTKAFTTQLVVLACFAIALARARGTHRRGARGGAVDRAHRGAGARQRGAEP